MRKHPLRIMIGTMVVVYGLVVRHHPDRQDARSWASTCRAASSVNLQPVKDGKVANDVSDGPARPGDRDHPPSRRRARRVAEPEVSRQGNTISVQMPGAKDQAEVLKLVGSTAELEFRPVLAGRWAAPDRQGQEEGRGARSAKLRTELAVPEGVTAAAGRRRTSRPSSPSRRPTPRRPIRRRPPSRPTAPAVDRDRGRGLRPGRRSVRHEACRPRRRTTVDHDDHAGDDHDDGAAHPAQPVRASTSTTRSSPSCTSSRASCGDTS